MIAVISGGVGAARFLRGLLQVIPASEVTAIVNTGDDTVLHGLAISPDLDTITYTLANAIDPDRGWGLADETWSTMAGLERYETVRPTGSNAAIRWFNLGDTDLATHLYRTARLAEGATLTQVTAEIVRAWGLDLAIVPMTDDRISTMLTVASTGEEISFQDYFVRLRHDIAISKVRFDHDGAQLSSTARSVLEAADVIVIAPSNPLVSIGPIRSLPGLDDLLATRRERVVAVSPIVGGAALKGPADRLLTEFGIEPSVTGIAELYASIASTLVIDPIDAALSPQVETAGMTPLVHPSVMSTPAIAADLAQATIQAAKQ